MRGMIIQMVGEDNKFVWGMFPILIAMGPTNDTPKLPEEEDIKKEVWMQLGKMVWHTNVIASNLINRYTPGEVGEEEQELDEEAGVEPRVPQTKLPEWSLAANKVKDKWPAYSSPKKAPKKTKPVENSFAEAEELEVSVPKWLQVKEAADTGSEDESSSSDSATESGEEEDGGPAITSTGKKDKRWGRKKDRDGGMVTVLAQVMSKAMQQQGKSTLDDVARFADTLLKGLKKSKSMKRKGEDTDLELQGKDFKVVDYGHKVVDWTIRDLLRPINGNFNIYWKEGTWGAEASPLLGTNLYPSLPTLSKPLYHTGRLHRNHHDQDQVLLLEEPGVDILQ